MPEGKGASRNRDLETVEHSSNRGIGQVRGEGRMLDVGRSGGSFCVTLSSHLSVIGGGRGCPQGGRYTRSRLPSVRSSGRALGQVEELVSRKARPNVVCKSLPEPCEQEIPAVKDSSSWGQKASIQDKLTSQKTSSAPRAGRSSKTSARFRNGYSGLSRFSPALPVLH